MSRNYGKITSISGSVVHVSFTKELPAIFGALCVQHLILEVQGYDNEKTGDGADCAGYDSFSDNRFFL